MITILDYGLGNPASVANMIKKAGGSAKITSDLGEIEQATKLIIPGVGHFSKGMQNLREGGFIEVLRKKACTDRVPVFGICLGMQLLTGHSEEGNVSGLDYIPADTIRFGAMPGFKIPHMGWDEVTIKPHPLFEGITEIPRYYFVHSYFVRCKSEANSIGTCNYGLTFDCAIAKDNVMGVQFHPEKSHRFGMQLFRNFISNF